MYPLNVQQPVGLIWDGQNYSCVYDSMLTILYSIWIQEPEVWTKRFEETSQKLTYLASEFHNVLSGTNCWKQHVILCRHDCTILTTQCFHMDQTVNR